MESDTNDNWWVEYEDEEAEEEDEEYRREPDSESTEMDSAGHPGEIGGYTKDTLWAAYKKAAAEKRT